MKGDALRKLKIFFGYAITGGLYIGIVGGIIFAIAGSIGFEDPTDLEAIGANIQQGNYMALAFAVGSLIIAGAFVWIIAIVGVKIRRALGSKESETIKFNKRPALLAFAGVGFVFTILFIGVNSFFMGVGGDANLLQSQTLLQGLQNGEPLVIAGTIIGLFVVGFLVAISAKAIPKITDSLPDTLTKI